MNWPAFACGLLAAMTFCSTAAAQTPAQGYPDRPVRLVVPFPAGTITDLVGRKVAEVVGRDLGQPVIIDNRVGAGGNIGADYVAKQPADGYTLFMGTTANLAVNATLYRLPYDPVTDFTPLSMGYYSCNLLVVSSQSRIHSLADLIAEAKRRPGQLNYGSPGVGTAGHLAGEWFTITTGTSIANVPFKGGPQILNELMAGRLDMSFEAVGNAQPLIRAGKLRPLATTCAERIPAFPDVPTMIESGVRDYDIRGWAMFMAPARLPDAIAARLAEAFFKALSSPETRDFIKANGMEPNPASPAATSAFLKEEIGKWGTIVRTAGIKLD